jgi:hypothetical protein
MAVLIYRMRLAHGSRPIRILCVEDDPGLARLVQKRLGRAGMGYRRRWQEISSNTMPTLLAFEISVAYPVVGIHLRFHGTSPNDYDNQQVMRCR